jgi:hypothetical protein
MLKYLKYLKYLKKEQKHFFTKKFKEKIMSITIVN